MRPCSSILGLVVVIHRSVERRRTTGLPDIDMHEPGLDRVNIVLRAALVLEHDVWMDVAKFALQITGERPLPAA